MSNIVPFAEVWHSHNPQGLSVSADRAWRHINIMRSSDVQKFAEALHMQCPVTSYFVSQMQVGRIHGYEFAQSLDYSRVAMRDSIKIAKDLHILKVVGKDLYGPIIQLTPYGYSIRNALLNGLFTKTG